MTELASATTKKIRELVRLELDGLARIRDEIRLKIHLAGMEGQSTWADLEKQFQQLDERFGRDGDHIVDSTRQIAAELHTAFRDFRKSFLSERRTDPDIPSSR